jgi:hypothetical protein
MIPLTISQPEIDTFLDWLFGYWQYPYVTINYWDWIDEKLINFN